ncbi:unnamed protein product [Caenorhabditis sp. 36 PRJEB53466]|nr:unnamed protein product [Caenorhabditis sp. 36 PRJEB53466]
MTHIYFLIVATVLLIQVPPIFGRSSRDAEQKEDTQACGSLRSEYVRVCTGQNTQKREQKDKDFCNAFENICFSIPEGEPDKPEGTSVSTLKPPTDEPPKKKNFAKFCREFKNRYLYVCPDPFRFGQKAIVFCPVYSEKCQVPLPDKPVVPQRKSSKRRGGGGAVDQLCRSYRGFAMNYCSNPFLTSQGQYRAAFGRFPEPECAYSVHHGNGRLVTEKVNIGDEIFHSWNCNYEGDRKNYLFCVMVNNCTVSDRGDDSETRKVQIIDEYGCSVFPNILPDISYESDLAAGIKVHAFALDVETTAVHFTCNIKMLFKEHNQCHRPSCARRKRFSRYSN